MKKILFGLLALSTVLMASEVKPTNVYLKAGVDIFSKTTIVKDDEGDTINKKHNKGFKGEFSAEITQVIMPKFEIGLGVAYQEHGKLKADTSYEDNYSDINLPKMKSYPVYAVAKYNIITEGDYKPYVFANLGYSFNDGKASTSINGIENGIKYTANSNIEYKNGMYWAIGVGMEIKNFMIDLSYKKNHGKCSWHENVKFDSEEYSENSKEKINYGRVTLGFGYKFDF